MTAMFLQVRTTNRTLCDPRAPPPSKISPQNIVPKKIEMPPFSFATQWCSCKKPMELRCDADPTGFFTNLSFGAALFAHNQHLDLQRAVPLSVKTTHTDPDTTIELSSVFTLTLSPPLFNCSVEASRRKCAGSIPDPDQYQCALLEARDWDAFEQSLSDPFGEMTDVIVRTSDSRMLARLILSNDHVQLHARGRVVCDGTDVSPCSWTSEHDGVAECSVVVDPVFLG